MYARLRGAPLPRAGAGRHDALQVTGPVQAVRVRDRGDAAPGPTGPGVDEAVVAGHQAAAGQGALRQVVRVVNELGWPADKPTRFGSVGDW